MTLIGGTAQPEIWTLTLGGSGTVIFQFLAETGYQTAPLNVATLTAAQLLAALNTIWPSWALPAGSVTGSTGGPFTITFGGSSGFGGSGDYARIGGAIQFVNVSGSPTATLVRTQRGSCGDGQYDYTDGTTNTVASVILQYTYPTGPTGSLVTAPYGPTNDSTLPAAAAWVQGFFSGADLLAGGFTTAIINASPKFSYYLGSSLTAGSQVYLSQ